MSDTGGADEGGPEAAPDITAGAPIDEPPSQAQDVHLGAASPLRRARLDLDLSGDAGHGDALGSGEDPRRDLGPFPPSTDILKVVRAHLAKRNRGADSIPYQVQHGVDSSPFSGLRGAPVGISRGADSIPSHVQHGVDSSPFSGLRGTPVGISRGAGSIPSQVHHGVDSSPSSGLRGEDVHVRYSDIRAHLARGDFISDSEDDGSSSSWDNLFKDDEDKGKGDEDKAKGDEDKAKGAPVHHYRAGSPPRLRDPCVNPNFPWHLGILERIQSILLPHPRIRECLLVHLAAARNAPRPPRAIAAIVTADGSGVIPLFPYVDSSSDEELVLLPPDDEAEEDEEEPPDDEAEEDAYLSGPLLPPSPPLPPSSSSDSPDPSY